MKSLLERLSKDEVVAVCLEENRMRLVAEEQRDALVAAVETYDSEYTNPVNGYTMRRRAREELLDVLRRVREEAK